jgi:peptidoglycan/xylan/chitin deacetylase (PgdA/CDA1 family)
LRKSAVVVSLAFNCNTVKSIFSPEEKNENALQARGGVADDRRRNHRRNRHWISDQQVAGHELGNHTWSHKRMVLKTPSFIQSEVERTDQLIRQAGHQGAIHFRPPFGKKLFLLPWYLAKNSRKTITWDVEPESYPEIDADSNRIIEHVLANTKPGSIILLHVMYKSRVESRKSVRGIISGLRREGYSFKTVSEMLNTLGAQASSPATLAEAAFFGCKQARTPALPGFSGGALCSLDDHF